MTNRNTTMPRSYSQRTDNRDRHPLVQIARLFVALALLMTVSILAGVLVSDLTGGLNPLSRNVPFLVAAFLLIVYIVFWR